MLNCLPDNMKAAIKKAVDCKKLTGLTCTPTCTAGHTFVMDGQEYRTCKNMALFHSLTAGKMEHLLIRIQTETESAVDLTSQRCEPTAGRSNRKQHHLC